MAADALRIAEDVAHAWAPSATAVVLHGSLVYGDFIPGRSDVDLLVVADDERAGPAAAQGVDLLVVSPEEAAAPDVSVVHGPRRDVVVQLSMCRRDGRSLHGVPPAQAIGEVPDVWVMAVGNAQLADWTAIGDDPPHAVLTVLTTCRMWRFAEERRHCSKRAAGEWALRQDPTLRVVRQALAARADPTAPAVDPAGVAALLDAVRRGSVGMDGSAFHPARDGDHLPRHVP